jgi:peptidoglycan-associated lipoprotein
MKRLLAIASLAVLLAVQTSPAAAHEYDRDDSDHPLRYVGYALHPFGVLVEKVILRPIHAFVSKPDNDIIFGHEVRHGDHGHDHGHGHMETVTPQAPVAEVPLAVPQEPPTMPEALPVPPDAPAERRIERADFPGARTIYFDYNKSAIRDDMMEDMTKNLNVLKENPDLQVQIVGHTDERGSTEYNFHLGTRRAEVVQKYLVDNGIAADRITIQSRGKEEPADPGHDEDAWAQNRRAEFYKLMVIETAPGATAKPTAEATEPAESKPQVWGRRVSAAN